MAPLNHVVSFPVSETRIGDVLALGDTVYLTIAERAAYTLKNRSRLQLLPVACEIDDGTHAISSYLELS
jgi:hypothetical protein